jgi:hypothetical protein
MKASSKEVFEAHSAHWRPLDLNDLPRWRPEWSRRLLGLTAFETPVRSVEKIEEEYNRDKWARALAMYEESGGTLSALRIREVMTDSTPEAERACIVDGGLAVSTCVAQYRMLFDLLEMWFGDSVAQSRSVVELGTAFGAFVTELSKRFTAPAFAGADFSENGVRLAKRLNEGNSRLSFRQVDFYEPRYDVLDAMEGPVTVFTAQAIEQLPSAAPFVDTLLKHRDKVRSVFHLEPVFEVQDDSLIGLMRQRYLEMNDYCRDLLGQLQARAKAGEIEIRRVEPDLFGFNPFNSLTLIEWRPV